MPSAQRNRSPDHYYNIFSLYEYDHRSNVIVQIFQLSRPEIEKIISLSIDYLDLLDGDFDLEQDIIDESNGDEDDYTTLEWQNTIN